MKFARVLWLMFLFSPSVSRAVWPKTTHSIDSEGSTAGSVIEYDDSHWAFTSPKEDMTAVSDFFQTYDLLTDLRPLIIFAPTDKIFWKLYFTDDAWEIRRGSPAILGEIRPRWIDGREMYVVLRRMGLNLDNYDVIILVMGFGSRRRQGGCSFADLLASEARLPVIATPGIPIIVSGKHWRTNPGDLMRHDRKMVTRSQSRPPVGLTVSPVREKDIAWQVIWPREFRGERTRRILDTRVQYLRGAFSNLHHLTADKMNRAFLPDMTPYREVLPMTLETTCIGAIVPQLKD
jgi:hypothetical protein